MRFYTQQHPHYCGIDLHARTMYLCILNQAGAIVLHRNMKSEPDSFLKAIAPFRQDIVVRQPPSGPAHPICWPTLQVHDREDSNAVFLYRVENSVRELANDAPANFSTNLWPGIRILEDCSDVALDLFQESDAETATLTFVIHRGIIHFSLSEFMKGDPFHLPELCACASQDALCCALAIHWTPGGVPSLRLLCPYEFVLLLRKVLKALQEFSSQARSIFRNKGEGNSFNLFDAHAGIVLHATRSEERRVGKECRL